MRFIQTKLAKSCGPRKSPCVALALTFFFANGLQAHDIITTAMTFDREVSRIMVERCTSCHHQGGSAFPLLTYADTRPWAVSIKEEILRRRMPPWGAVKGFGEFRNDQGLSAEELEVLVSWIDGGVPEGNEKDLPDIPDIIKTEMKLSFVESMDQVLKIALEREVQPLPMPAAIQAAAETRPEEVH